MTLLNDSPLVATAYVAIPSPNVTTPASLPVLKRNAAFDSLLQADTPSPAMVGLLLSSLADLEIFAAAVVQVELQGELQEVHLVKFRDDLGVVVAFRKGDLLSPPQQAEAGLEEAAESLIQLQEQVSSYTGEHSGRMRTLAGAFGSFCELDEEDAHNLQLMAELHDIGKLFISRDILEKPDRLNEVERGEIQNHTVYGYLFLHSVPALRSFAPIILMHHERWDGSGYPVGLAGEEIPLLSRILSLLDAFDAMANDRPYRKSMPTTVALQEMEDKLNTQFDPHLGVKFLQFMRESGLTE